jgi:hypothetical protein
MRSRTSGDSFLPRLAAAIFSLASADRGPVLGGHHPLAFLAAKASALLRRHSDGFFRGGLIRPVPAADIFAFASGVWCHPEGGIQPAAFFAATVTARFAFDSSEGVRPKCARRFFSRDSGLGERPRKRARSLAFVSGEAGTPVRPLAPPDETLYPNCGSQVRNSEMNFASAASKSSGAPPLTRTEKATFVTPCFRRARYSRGC